MKIGRWLLALAPLLVAAAALADAGTGAARQRDGGADARADAASRDARSEAERALAGDASIDVRLDAGLASDAAVGADAEMTGPDAADGGEAVDAAGLSDAGDAAAVPADAASEPPDAAITAPGTLEEKAPPPPPKEAAKTLLRTVIGMLLLLALAYLGGSRPIRRAEEALGIRTAITMGFPFVALGLIARHPLVGVLDAHALEATTPLLHFGLGWLGFLLGFRFDLQALDRLPAGRARQLVIATSTPFAMIALVCGIVLLALGQPLGDASFLRDGIVLATAGAMTAARGNKRDLATHLDEIVGVIGLTFLAAYFRPHDVETAWTLPGTAWLFVTIGMGAVFGIVVYGILRRPASRAEFLLIAIGSVGFTSGMAAYLHLSPIVVCFVAGACVVNLPSQQRGAFRETLVELERPIYLVFLMIVGVLWDPADWRGWLLMGVFVVTRFFGLWLGTRIARSRGEPPAPGAQALSPFAPLSIVAVAIVINAQDLYQGAAVPWIVTAVIGGALASEIIAHFADRIAGRTIPTNGEQGGERQQTLVIAPPVERTRDETGGNA